MISAALVLLAGCGVSTTAPQNGNPRPTGTFVLVQSAQDSSSEVVAAPAGATNSCVTFVSRLRFAAPDSVVATRQFVLPSSGGTGTIVTQVDAGIVTTISGGALRLAYPARIDTASVQMTNGAITQVNVGEHFVSSSQCQTARVPLSYKLQLPSGI